MDERTTAVRDERTGLTYRWEGDVLLPVMEPENSAPPLSRYGMMRKEYLKENQPGLYTHLLMSGELYPLMHQVDEAAEQRLQQLMEKLPEQAGATEKLKAGNPEQWEKLMDDCLTRAEEIILAELVYARSETAK